MIRREVEVATNTQMSAWAVVQAIREVFPEHEAQFLAAFEKHLDYESTHGEMAAKLAHAYPVLLESAKTIHSASALTVR